MQRKWERSELTVKNEDELPLLNGPGVEEPVSDGALLEDDKLVEVAVFMLLPGWTWESTGAFKKEERRCRATVLLTGLRTTNALSHSQLNYSDQWLSLN